MVIVSPDRPPRPEDLAGAAAVYVACGLTPAYRDVMVGAGTGMAGSDDGTVSLRRLLGRGRDRAGTALVGGWQTTIGGRNVPVVPEDCAEDLEPLTISRGLGVVPFLVETCTPRSGAR